MLESLCNKVAGLQASSFIKKIPQHGSFLQKYCKVSKNTYFEEHLPTAVSNLFGVNK